MYGQATNSISANNKNIKINTDNVGKVKAALKKAIASKDDETITQLRSQISTIEKSLSKLKALNVKHKNELLKSYKWEVEGPAPYDLILAGNILFLGAKDIVLGYDAVSGKKLWSAKSQR